MGQLYTEEAAIFSRIIAPIISGVPAPLGGERVTSSSRAQASSSVMRAIPAS
jgi:hypothetical protein